MRPSSLAAILLAAACVDVPDHVRAEFAPATPADRSNFRKGPHGLARPVDVGTSLFAKPGAKVADPSVIAEDAGAVVVEVEAGVDAQLAVDGNPDGGGHGRGDMPGSDEAGMQSGGSR